MIGHFMPFGFAQGAGQYWLARHHTLTLGLGRTNHNNRETVIDRPIKNDGTCRQDVRIPKFLLWNSRTGKLISCPVIE
jgi:hypothetical protein